MSDTDVKALCRLAGDAWLSTGEDETYDAVQRADELIRALDAESDAHMRQVSAEEKGSEPENSSG